MQVNVKHIPSYFRGVVSEPESPMISATLTFPCKITKMINLKFSMKIYKHQANGALLDMLGLT